MLFRLVLILENFLYDKGSESLRNRKICIAIKICDKNICLLKKCFVTLRA